MKEWILQNIVTIFTTILGGSSLAAYFFERKKNRALTSQEFAKASQEEATALSNMRQAYKDFTEDMNQRYEALRTDFDEFKKTMEEKLKIKDEEYFTLQNA